MFFIILCCSFCFILLLIAFLYFVVFLITLSLVAHELITSVTEGTYNFEGNHMFCFFTLIKSFTDCSVSPLLAKKDSKTYFSFP